MIRLNEERGRIPSIEFFRFLATCCIAVWHLSVVDKLRHGYLPVEFFFILSGVWLYNTYLKRQGIGYTAFRYTMDRAKRIYPAYLIACCIYFILTWKKFQSTDGWLKALSELLLLRDGGGVYSNGIAYVVWYLSAMLIGGYFVYALLDRFGQAMVTLICPMVALGGYTGLFSLGESIEHWGSFGPISVPLLRGLAGLCLGVCLRALALHLEENINTFAYSAINVLSVLSPFGIVVCLLSQEYLDRYCLIFFSAILLACLLEHSWLNQAIQGAIWQCLAKFSSEMYMIHISIIIIWKRLPWNPNGPVEKSIYIIAYLITVFLSAIVLAKLSNALYLEIKENRIKGHRKWILCFAMMVCCTWIACHQKIWSDLDNYYVAMITNGVFGEQNIYAQYLHPFLCWIISVLHKLLPQADCFSLLIRTLLIAGGGWIGFILAEHIKHFSLACGVCAIILAIVLTSELFGSNYTIIAAVLSFVGLFSICLTFSNKAGKKHLIIGGIFFLACGFMLRKESGQLTLPFFALAVLAEVLPVSETKRGNYTTAVKIATISGAIIGMLLLSNMVFWKSPGHVLDAQYNANRTTIVDYPVKPWEEIRGQLSGVSKNDYDCIRNWIFADTEFMDGDFMGELAAKAAIKSTLNVESFIKANRVILNVLCTRKVMIFFIWLVVLFIVLLFSPQKKYERLETVLAIIGAYVIMLYLAFKGRFPNRVCIAVCLPALAILFVNLLKVLERPISIRPFVVAALITSSFLAYLYTPGQIVLSDKLALSWTANAPANEADYEHTYQDDAIYLCNSNMMTAYWNQGKLPTAEYMKHYVSWGDWTYGQTYHREFLNNLGIPNPMQALLTREHTYLLCHDNTLVFRYLQEHYDANVTVVQVGTINGEEVWEFSIPQ